MTPSSPHSPALANPRGQASGVRHRAATSGTQEGESTPESRGEAERAGPKLGHRPRWVTLVRSNRNQAPEGDFQNSGLISSRDYAVPAVHKHSQNCEGHVAV